MSLIYRSVDAWLSGLSCIFYCRSLHSVTRPPVVTWPSVILSVVVPLVLSFCNKHVLLWFELVETFRLNTSTPSPPPLQKDR